MATEAPAAPAPGRPAEPIERDRSTSAASGSSPPAPAAIEVLDSTTEQVIGRVPEGTPEDVDRAVKAARAGFEAWSAVPFEGRLDALQGIAAALAARGDELAALIAAEVGMPLAQSRTIQAGLPAMDFGGTAQVAREVVWEEQVGNSLVVREPIGVVGAITPWNYPLHQLCAKVAPALAAGCSVVAKPSEVTPLSAFVLAEIIDELGLPAGVFNLVTGFGPVVGAAIAAHDDVDMVSLHRLHPRGRAGHRGGGQERQARLAGARRQVGERDPRRRRPEAGGRLRGRQLLPQLGPDLQRAHPDAGPAREARRGRGRSPRRRPR